MAKRPSYDPRRHSAQARSLTAAVHSFGSGDEPVTGDELADIIVRACNDQGDNYPDADVVAALLRAYVATRENEGDGEEPCDLITATEAEQLYREQYGLGFKVRTKHEPDPESCMFPDALDWRKDRHYPADIIATLGFNEGCRDGATAVYIRDNYDRIAREYNIPNKEEA